MVERTAPRKTGIDPVADAPRLAHGRYGTRETCDLIVEATDPLRYIGQSRSQVEAVYAAFHGKRTFT